MGGMSLNFRFAVISDPHIALPHTIWDNPNRFHLVEVSIPSLELIFSRLEQLDLDFLLLPGDLTQHGEPDNHRWLASRLSQLPFPVYVVPGNHDVPHPIATETTIGLQDFPAFYSKFGYDNPNQLYYTRMILPGVRLIGLNSNQFTPEGKLIGRIDDSQLAWLDQVLAEVKDELVMVMVHHNVVEHLPDQALSPWGRRYVLQNASELLSRLQTVGAKLIFTGHLHVQDIASWQGIYEITTGSLVSYPHPYRLLQFHTNTAGQAFLQIESTRVERLPDWPDLLERSRHWMGERSPNFMRKFLTHFPFNLSLEEAEQILPELRYFWADFAAGNPDFSFPQLPESVRQIAEKFSARDDQGYLNFIDNDATLLL